MKETLRPPREQKEPRFQLARKLEPPSGDYHWIYLWEWPIRAMHWIAVVCIIGLTVTGLYIGKPYFIAGGDTGDHFMMGWVRFVHFALAAAFVATGIVRGYWLFAGNRFERWRASSRSARVTGSTCGSRSSSI
jgi:Ni,Fe-hydrogenase I cytochrome b subunit